MEKELMLKDIREYAKKYFTEEGYTILPRDLGVQFRIQKDDEQKGVNIITGKATRTQIGKRYFTAFPLGLKQIIFTENPVEKSIQDEFSDVEFLSMK